MSKEKKQKAPVPRLRFPEFRNAPAWKEKQLKHLFDERTEKGGEELPLLSLTEAEGLIRQEHSGRKDNSNADKSRYARVYPGDIAYNTMRMWEGRSALACEAGLVSPAYTVCIPKDSVDSRFFAYYFKTAQAIAQFRRFSQGLVKDTLSLKFDRFAKIQLPTTSPGEQRKIADCLGSLDDWIAAEGRKLEALRDHKKGLMQQLFPREGETHPRLRFPEFRDAGEWKESTVGSKCQSFSGGTPDTTRKDFYGGTIPFIRSAEIGSETTTQFLTEEGYEGSAAKMVTRGDVLVALYGANSGDVALARLDGAINQAILCLCPEGSKAFLYHYLTQRKDWILAKYLQGGQGNLSGEIVKSVSLRFPSPEEQETIADCLASLDAMISSQAKKLDALRTHKRGLMQQLFPMVEGVA